MKKLSFEKLTRILMVASLVSVTSMFVFVGCGSSSSQVIEENTVPTTGEPPVDEVAEVVAPSYETYKSSDGWSVKYDPEYIDVNEGNGIVCFVYTGECAGTCMVTISTLEGTTAEEARDDLVEAWGTENIEHYEAPFSAQEKEGYWAYYSTQGGAAGSGLFETAIAVDHNDKTILAECTEHMGGDEMMDMTVSDELAIVIDTMEFN